MGDECGIGVECGIGDEWGWEMSSSCLDLRCNFKNSVNILLFMS